MRLNEISEVDNTQQIFAQIRQECADFLAYTTKPLYRGMKNRNADTYKLDIRTDRRPKDLTPFETAVINAVYYAMSNFKFVRNSCLFATHDDLFAEDYGDLFYVFPIDESEIFFLQGIEDVAALSSIGEGTFEQTLYKEVENYLRSAFSQQIPDNDMTHVVDDLSQHILYVGNFRKVTTPEEFSRTVDKAFYHGLPRIVQNLQGKIHEVPTGMGKRIIDHMRKELSPDVITPGGLDHVKGHEEFSIIAPHAYVVRADAYPDYAELLAKIRGLK